MARTKVEGTWAVEGEANAARVIRKERVDRKLRY
jgi:hypothetical protein